MENLYIAVTIQENKKYYSYVIKANTQENILYKLKIKNIINATVTKQKQRAENLVNLWNLIYKKNNQYLFDETF